MLAEFRLAHCRDIDEFPFLRGWEYFEEGEMIELEMARW